MKKNYIFVVVGALIFGCAEMPNSSSPSLARRKIASASSTHDANVKTLDGIPLFEGIEIRDSEKEPQFISELEKIFSEIQDQAKNSDQSLNRGTHAKGSCYNGALTVFSKEYLKEKYGYSEDLIRRLKHGIFSWDENGKEKIYNAEIRFANARGDINNDRMADVRAVSFSLDLNGDFKDYSGESRQDFMFNSTPMFAVNNIHEFLELMKADRLSKKEIQYIPNPLYIPVIKKAADLLKEYQRADTLSYLTEEYWSNIPYTHGLNSDRTPQELVKIKLSPCDGKGIRHASSDGKPDDYLQQNLEEQSMAGKACFTVQLQLFNLKSLQKSLSGRHSQWKVSDWIENGGELWDESYLPFYKVGKIEIKVVRDSYGQVVSQKSICEDKAINTRLHSFPESQPLGSLARGRALVEENSRARRMKETSEDLAK